MKRFVFAFFIIFHLSVHAQQTLFLNDPQESFKQAQEYYQKQYYSLAYPIFKELEQQQLNKLKGNQSFEYQNIHYYTVVCSLGQDDSSAVDPATRFIAQENNEARVEMMSFHLAEYDFRHGRYQAALQLYEKAGIDNLSTADIANLKFHQGYAYFIRKDFDKAKPLMDAIRQIPKDPNYIDANYYFGFISFYQKKYSDASAAFYVVENSPKYKSVVPYYIANIYLIQGQKNKAIEYAASKLGAGDQYYDLELRQLTGHGYYEQKEFQKALPFLETYISRSKKVSRQDIYELSYCYYQLKDYNRAIEGFKQLGNEEDSLAQNAMYLLGDSYLKTGQLSNARNAFLFCASNSSNAVQKEISAFHYAKLSFELGYPDIALNGFRNFLITYPSSVYTKEARELLLRVLANTSNYRDALALMDSIGNSSETANQLYPRILYGRALELVTDGQLIAANDLMDKALRAKNNSALLPGINFWKGELSYRLNRIDDAIPYYFEYLKSPVEEGEMNAVTAKYNLGYCFLKKENYRQAEGFFEQVSRSPKINASPLEQDAYVRTADCYYMDRDFRTALLMYNRVLDFSWPASDYATFQKAMVTGVSNSSEKISLLNGLIRKYPGSPLTADANMEIANTYLSNEQFRESIPYLKNVLSATGNDAVKPRAYLRAGIAYYNLENNKEALNQYNQLLKQYPNAPEAQDALENAKSIYVEEGRSSEYVNFAKSMGVDVSSSQEDQLAYQEAEVQFNNGNFATALQKFEDYLQKFPDGKFSLEANYYKSEMYFNQKSWSKAATGYEIVAGKAPNKFAEKSLLQAARINFFYLKDYAKSEGLYARLKDFSTSQENKTEAMRGLLRSQYELQHWADAADNAKDLIGQKGLGTDDRVLANMVLGKSYQSGGDCPSALPYFRTVASLSRAAFGAEAQYLAASCLYEQNQFRDAEKAAFEVVHKSGSYELWVTKSYLLLGDIYFREKDYFNAKATYQSIVENAKIETVRVEAEQRLDQVKEEESKNSKISNDNH
jgi:TolA-binding protein